MADGSPSEGTPQLETVAARVRRYAALRSAQRALYPIRSLPGRHPAEDKLGEIRRRLQEIPFLPQTRAEDADGAAQINRVAALRKIDDLLSRVAREFRSIAAAVNIAELRAALPEVRASQPREVAALLDLCLEDEEAASGLISLIDYLATLLATEVRDGERVLVADPVSVTPLLFEVCERLRDYDPEEVRAHLEAFDTAIVELNQSDELDPVMEEARELKARLGRLIFVPPLFRKIVEYNTVAANRLQDELEAERTLHEIDVETAAVLELAGPELEPDHEETAEPDTESPATDDDRLEIREAQAIREIADAVARHLSEEAASGDQTDRIAQVLDLSVLSAWERLALTSAGNSGDDLLPSIIVVGSLLRKRDELEEDLADLGLSADRLEEEWVDRLDARVQNAIAQNLRENDHAEAKRLSQTRAKFLYRVLEVRRRAQAVALRNRSKDERPSEERTYERELRLPRDETRRAPKRRTRSTQPETRARVPKTPLVLALALAAIAVAAALQFNTTKDERAVSVLPPDILEEFSPYLESGYRDGVGFGLRFFGTLTDQWKELPDEEQRRELIQIGDRLRWAGVKEVMLFDKQRRMRARYLSGKLLHPETRQ